MRSLFIALTMLALMAVPATAQAAAGAGAMPACAASDPVVWINTKSNVYHQKGDKYFGTTKQGKYACTSAALKAGAHAAKSGAMGKGAAAAAAADATATDAPTGKKHKKHKGAEPSPTPT